MELVCLNQRRGIREHGTKIVITDVILLAYLSGRHAPSESAKDPRHWDPRATDHGLPVLNRWINHNTIMHPDGPWLVVVLHACPLSLFHCSSIHTHVTAPRGCLENFSRRSRWQRLEMYTIA
jgi:hypothetical protein